MRFNITKTGIEPLRKITESDSVLSEHLCDVTQSFCHPVLQTFMEAHGS